MIERRSLIKGLVALVTAPAIVKVASLMPVNARLQPGSGITEYWAGRVAQVDVLYGSLRMGDAVTWQADVPGPMRAFMVSWQEQVAERFQQAVYDDVVARSEHQADFLSIQGEQWTLAEIARMKARQLVYNKERRSIDRVPQIPASLVLAATAVAVAPKVLATPVTRRFWKLPQHSAASQED